MEFKELQLRNGAKLYVLPIPTAKIVALGVHVNVGTRDEIWPKEAGLAHATEHMLFQGTEEFQNSKAITEYIESVGGALNAFTCNEMTFYFNALPCEEKKRGFEILSQQLQKSFFLPEKITPEMQNIIQEIHQKNDSPPAFLESKLYEILYAQHPLGKETLGLEESLLNLKQEDFNDFTAKFYHPDNLTFLAVGNIKPKEAKRFFEKYFPKSDKKPKNLREFLKVSAVPKDTIIQKEIEQAHISLGATTCPAKDRDSLVLKTFRTMIDGGMSFPLFQEVRDKKGLCYEIRANYDPWSDVGIFYIYLGTSPERKEEAKRAVVEVIQGSKKSDALLEKTKVFIKGRLAFAFEDTIRILEGAAFDITSGGRPENLQEKLKKIQSITIEEVEKAVDSYLFPERLTEVSLVPKSE